MDIVERVRGYVHDVLEGPSADDIGPVTPFESGDRHAVYRVQYRRQNGASGHVVVRVSTSGDAGECAQARIEAAVLQKLAGVGAPTLYDFRVDSAWFDTPSMCMEHIDGRQAVLVDASHDDLDRLGAVIAAVHNLPLGRLREVFTAVTDLESYVRERLSVHEAHRLGLPTHLPGVVDGRVARAFRSVAQRLEIAERSASFPPREPLVLLHGDISSDNILWAKDPVLIDWEYARLGDPADEIAYIFGQHGLTPAQRAALWAGYERVTMHPSPEQLIERARWWEPVLLLGSVAWWLKRWARSAAAEGLAGCDPTAPKAPDYYLEQACRRLDRFDEAISK